MEIRPRHFKKFYYSEEDIFVFMKRHGFFPYVYSELNKQLIYSKTYDRDYLDYYFLKKQIITDLSSKGLLINS